MAFQPVHQCESPDRARPRGRGIRRQVPEHPVDRLRHRLGLRRHLPLPGREVRDSHPGRVSDELDRAAAGRVRDGEPTRHRLEDERRARILHLRVQEEMRTSHDRGSVPLVVLTEKLDVVLEA